MQINSEDIRSVRSMSQAAFWRQCNALDFDLLLGFSLDSNNLPCEDKVLIVDLDPFFEGGPWLDFEGRRYYVDMDLNTVQTLTTDTSLGVDDMPVAFAYYVELDAYLPSLNHPFVRRYRQLKSKTN